MGNFGYWVFALFLRDTGVRARIWDFHLGIWHLFSDTGVLIRNYVRLLSKIVQGYMKWRRIRIVRDIG